MTQKLEKYVLSCDSKLWVYCVHTSVLSPSDNPWRCDCALHWLRSWIDEEGQRLLSSAERRLVCTEPPRLSHLSLVEVPLNSLVCIPPLVQLEPRRLAVRLGESLRVSCHASGYPRPQVSLDVKDESLMIWDFPFLSWGSGIKMTTHDPFICVPHMSKRVSPDRYHVPTPR